MTMQRVDPGANQFVFSGDKTEVTFFPVTPGPVVSGHEGGELRFEGPEGDLTFFGEEITKLETLFGTTLTVAFEHNPDIGGTSFTVFLPQVFGVNQDQPVTFGTIAVKTTGRGLVAGPGASLTYDVLPLVGQAKSVILPL